MIVKLPIMMIVVVTRLLLLQHSGPVAVVLLRRHITLRLCELTDRPSHARAGMRAC
jgi:hypothetical protein